MAEKVPQVLRLYRSLQKLSPRGWLFSRLICWRAPYFASIRPRIAQLAPGHCAVEIEQRRHVQNHIGTVHAIALCNMAELAAGLVIEASLSTRMRWIPKGMEVSYLAKAKGRMRAEATPQNALAVASEGYDAPIAVRVTDAAGTEVFRALIRMWVTPKPQRQPA